MKTTHHVVLAVAAAAIVTGPMACSSPDPSGSPVGELGAALSSGAPIVSAVGGKCLDDSGDKTVNGNKIQLWSCNGTGAQDWSLTGGALVGPGGKCLDVKYDEQQSGTIAWLYDCNGTAAQKWTVSGTQIKSSGGLCLDARGGVNANGTQVQIETCDGAASQEWTTGSKTAPDGGGGGQTPYPIFSSLFRGNTPFHHTVASLMAVGATVRPAEIAEHYWAEGIGTAQPFNPSSGLGPLYQVHQGDPGYVFSCPAYGKCTFSGSVVHFPEGAAASTGSDHHLVSLDPVYLDGEVDGWGGYGPADEQCNLIAGSPSGKVTCSWGGFYPFSGPGLANPPGESGTAGGYALGMIDITAQELLQGHIDHALGITESCLDDGGIYPSTPGRTTDAKCPSSQEPNAVYGDMIHLKAGVDVTKISANKYCQTVLTALQTYGAYTSDNNGQWGIGLLYENPEAPVYATKNPWTETIYPSWLASGDATGSATGPLYFDQCLKNVPASDIEVIQISTTLPALP
jgi:hypothetical protein